MLPQSTATWHALPWCARPCRPIPVPLHIDMEQCFTFQGGEELSAEVILMMPTWLCRRRLELWLHGRVSDQLLWKCLKGRYLPSMPVGTSLHVISAFSIWGGQAIKDAAYPREPVLPCYPSLRMELHDCAQSPSYSLGCIRLSRLKVFVHPLQMCPSLQRGRRTGLGGSGTYRRRPSAPFRGPTSWARLQSGSSPPPSTPFGAPQALIEVAPFWRGGI